MKVFAVGKIKDGRLLLYALYEKEKDADKHKQFYVEKYYKRRPWLCRVVVKAVEIKK